MGALIARCAVCKYCTLSQRAALKFERLVNSGKLIDLMFFDGQVNTVRDVCGLSSDTSDSN